MLPPIGTIRTLADRRRIGCWIPADAQSVDTTEELVMTDVDHPTTRSVGLEHLSLTSETLLDFVEAAAGGGADSVCLSVNHRDIHDPRLRAEGLARIADLGLTISMADGFLVGPLSGGMDKLKRSMDLLVEYGAPYANACAFEPDLGAPRDPASVEEELGELCRLARSAGLGVLLEFTPLSHVVSLSAATDLVARLAEPNLTILVDTMHLVRAGEGPDDLAALDPSLIGYCQVSDGPLRSPSAEAYLDEALHERAVPGQGEFPLERIIALLPPTVTISAEVPMRARKEAGVPARERARLAVQGTRDVVARALAH
jgi:sugar phosphate isomerase/epimerase